MDILTKLTEKFSMAHPLDVAICLEKMSFDNSTEVFSILSPGVSAEVAKLMSQSYLREVMYRMPGDKAAGIIENIPVDVSATILRGLPSTSSNNIKRSLKGQTQKSIESLLKFSPESVGAIMDSSYFSVTENSTVGEAVSLLREVQLKCEDGFFILNRKRKLTGKVLLQKLALASLEQNISAISEPVGTTISPNTPVHSLLENFELTTNHILPVVDKNENYVGVLREDAIEFLNKSKSGLNARSRSVKTYEAMGELFRLGILGPLHAVMPADTDHVRKIIQKGENR